jgi:hypothetical protein
MFLPHCPRLPTGRFNNGRLYCNCPLMMWWTAPAAFLSNRDIPSVYAWTAPKRYQVAVRAKGRELRCADSVRKTSRSRVRPDGRRYGFGAADMSHDIVSAGPLQLADRPRCTPCGQGTSEGPISGRIAWKPKNDVSLSRSREADLKARSARGAVCVYTAIFGSYDRLQAPPESLRRDSTDFICFTDDDKALECPGWKVRLEQPRYSNPRMSAKYFSLFRQTSG